MSRKIYQRHRLKFHIQQFACPAEIGEEGEKIPTFESGEWLWIVAKNPNEEEFRFLHAAKVEDHRYQLMPAKETKYPQHWNEATAKAMEDCLAFAKAGFKEPIHRSPPIDPKNDELGEIMTVTREIFASPDIAQKQQFDMDSLPF